MNMNISIRLTKDLIPAFKRLEGGMPSLMRLVISRALIEIENKVSTALRKGTYGIKTREGTLRRSFTWKIMGRDKPRGIFGSNLVYAEIQEKGGRINITKRMSSFAWSRWYDTGNLMWKAIALKKGRQIKIPAHWYVRGSFRAAKSKILTTTEKTIIEALRKVK